jgi:hypothetical protein
MDMNGCGLQLELNRISATIAWRKLATCDTRNIVR